MTAQEYRAVIKGMGLTPSRPSYEGATIHQDREGNFVTVLDAEGLSPREREGFIELLIMRDGYSRSN